jgi:hypothetical protein
MDDIKWKDCLPNIEMGAIILYPTECLYLGATNHYMTAKKEDMAPTVWGKSNDQSVVNVWRWKDSDTIKYEIMEV